MHTARTTIELGEIILYNDITCSQLHLVKNIIVNLKAAKKKFEKITIQIIVHSFKM